jgi:hypothetical protein
VIAEYPPARKLPALKLIQVRECVALRETALGLQSVARRDISGRRVDCDFVYSFCAGCYVLSVQIAQNHGRDGGDGRFWKHRHQLSLGWGPKGRWFKSSRPDSGREPLHEANERLGVAQGLAVREADQRRFQGSKAPRRAAVLRGV